MELVLEQASNLLSRTLLQSSPISNIPADNKPSAIDIEAVKRTKNLNKPES